jgi:hypothetical protein
MSNKNILTFILSALEEVDIERDAVKACFLCGSRNTDFYRTNSDLDVIVFTDTDYDFEILSHIHIDQNLIGAHIRGFQVQKILEQPEALDPETSNAIAHGSGLLKTANEGKIKSAANGLLTFQRSNFLSQACDFDHEHFVSETYFLLYHWETEISELKDKDPVLFIVRMGEIIKELFYRFGILDLKTSINNQIFPKQIELQIKNLVYQRTHHSGRFLNKNRYFSSGTQSKFLGLARDLTVNQMESNEGLIQFFQSVKALLQPWGAEQEFSPLKNPMAFIITPRTEP